MHDYTEYSISVDGTPVPGWPTTRDKDSARHDAAAWRDMYPHQCVKIVHRRVTIGDWATTTP